MIDKSYYEANMTHYYMDYLFSLVAFAVGFIWCLNAEFPVIIIPLIVSARFLCRAGSFVHEITHRRDPAMKRFARLWNMTAGVLTLLPAPRFFKPHLTHHSNGVFGTKDDPQYLPLRTNHLLMVFVVFVSPFLMPIFNLILATTASLGVNAEPALERLLRCHGFTMGSDLDARYRREVTDLSRVYLAVFAAYVALLPETLPTFYVVSVMGWFIVTLRIPLEHRRIGHVEETTARDHVLDSFTVESPLAAIVQPAGLRFHTAHHIYPGVPYHNLRRLHEELKTRGDPGYNNNVISFWRALCGPKPVA